MVHAILSRIGQSIGVAFAMSLIVFVGVNYIGNPVYLLVAQDATQEEIDRVITALGLDRPVPEQYLLFLKSFLDGGVAHSFVSGRPAFTVVLERFPATLELAVTAMLLAVVIGIPLGIAAGYFHGSRFSRAVMAGSVLGFSVPGFWIGMMLIMVFAVYLGWLPSGGRGETATMLGITSSAFTLDGLRHLLLPALTLSLFKISLAVRLAAAGTREAIHLDYVKFARAKGLSEGRIVGVHVAKNIMIPIVTVMGMEFAQLMAFAVVTESVFNWPGMGKVFIDSIKVLDRPVIVSYMILVVLIFVIVNFVVDMIYLILDPKVRLTGEGR